MGFMAENPVMNRQVSDQKIELFKDSLPVFIYLAYKSALLIVNDFSKECKFF
jgi:hypothetical protein